MVWGRFKLICTTLVVVNLVLAQGLLDVQHPHVHFGPPEYVTLNLVNGGSTNIRSKRHTSSCFSEVMVFDTTVDGENVTLQLTENTHIDCTVPVHRMTADGNIVVESVPVLKESRIYQDKAHNAAVGIGFVRLLDGSCQYQVEGSFSMRKGMYTISPVHSSEKGEQRGGGRHVVHSVRTTADFRGDYVRKDDDSVRPSKPTRPANKSNHSPPPHRTPGRPPHRFKRMTPQLYTVDLFIVVDNLVYDFWLNRTVSATAQEKENEAIAAIRQYYAFILNSVDLRYQNIVEQDVQFRVQFAGMFLATTDAASPFTSTLKTENPDNPDRPLVDAGDSLEEFKTWMAANGNQFMTDYDHAMLFTKAEYVFDGSTTTAGLAFLSRACTVDGVSVCEDVFDFITAVVAAHELGHNLGARHDGEDNNGCSLEDHFIMAASTGSSSVNPQNPWNFSNCSVEYFRTYINSLDASNTNCLLDAGDNSATLAPLLQVLPGQFYSIDTQCIYTLGSESYACRGFYNVTTYPNTCDGAHCSIPGSGSCRRIFPARGTSCGDKKWCIDGVCVEDNEAPSTSDSCPWGDSPQTFSDSSTCANITPTNARNCYTDFYRLRCCAVCPAADSGNPDCPYGNRIADCSAIDSDPTQCYSSRNVRLCCGSCQLHEDPSKPGCEYGDKNSGCSALRPEDCPLQSQDIRDICCDTCGSFPTTTTTDPTTTTTDPTTTTTTTTTDPTTTTTTTDPTTTTTTDPTTTTTTTDPTTTTTTDPTTTTTTTDPTTTTTTTDPTTTTTTADPTTTTTTADTTTTTTDPTTTTTDPTTTTTTTTDPPTTTTTTTTDPTTTTTTDPPTTTTTTTTTTTDPTTTTTTDPTTTTTDPTTTDPTTNTPDPTNTTPVLTTTTTTPAPTTTTPAPTNTNSPPTTMCEDTTYLAWVEDVGGTGHCDTSAESCVSPTVILNTRSPVSSTSQLLCKFRLFSIGEAGPLLTNSNNLVGAGEFVRCDRVRCNVPGAVIPTSNGRSVTGMLVSVSEEGQQFGTEGLYLAYDRRCVTCSEHPEPRCIWNMTMCFIDGQCVAHGSTHPIVPCLVCDTARSDTAWSVLAGFCYINNQCLPDFSPNPASGGACSSCRSTFSQTAFTTTVGSCLINNVCYADGQLNPAGFCSVCNSAVTPTIFTPRENVCQVNEVCYAHGQGHPFLSCLVCNVLISTQQLSVRPGMCYVNGRCYPEGYVIQCSVCRSAQNQLAFTTSFGQGAGFCYINGQCVSDGARNPTNACLHCAPSTLSNAWTERTLLLSNGTRSSCSSVCLFYEERAKTALDFLCIDPRLQSILLNFLCLLSDMNELDNLPCAISDKTRSRLLAFCLPPPPLYLMYSNVCPDNLIQG